MGAVTRGEPLSLTHLPANRVIRVAGLTDEQLAVSLDPLPEGAPVVIRYRIERRGLSQRAIVDDALAQLEAMAVDLYPAWLPDASSIDTTSDFDLRVVREVAHRRAGSSTHFGPLLADLAEAAQSGRPLEHRLGPDVRATGVARIIADSYGRTGVVLIVGAPASDVAEPEQRSIAAAFEWLAHHGIGVWLTGAVVALVHRYPTWQLPVPRHVDTLSAGAAVEPVAQLAYPPLAGKPHPASAAEQELERSLARSDWARGRSWNQHYESHSLAPPIRVDLMWLAERCAVEIDGPDHRGSLKYAADRRRDNGLTLDGFAVLRFTNEEILDDPLQVLAVIESLLSKKRHDEGKLP